MKHKQSYLFVLLTAFAFGTMEIALKIAGNAFTALQLTFLRFLIGGLILLPFALKDLKRRAYHLTPGDWVYLLALGVVNICFSMTLFQIGVMMTNASLAAVIISINPVFTMLFAHFIVHDYFTRKKAVVLILSLIGLVIVANPENLLHGNGVQGVLIVLAASIGFGFYTALGKKRVNQIGGLAQNSFSFLLGSVVEFLILLFRGEPILSGITVHSVWVLLYVGVVVTGFGYVCYMKAIELSNPSTASIAFFIKPIVAIALSALILSEPITWNVIAGTLLILIGCLYNLKQSSKTEQQALSK
ncbi:MAG: DMT family transporter [Candidatus Onthomonas sp.]|nr:DMT family transporter [Candidatus Onthomonas sp.]